MEAPEIGPPNIASRPIVPPTAIAAASPTARVSVATARAAPASTAAAARRWLDDGQLPSLRARRLPRLNDRSVHPVRDLVREAHVDLLEAGRLEPGDVLAPRERAGDAADVASALR